MSFQVSNEVPLGPRPRRRGSRMSRGLLLAALTAGVAAGGFGVAFAASSSSSGSSTTPGTTAPGTTTPGNPGNPGTSHGRGFGRLGGPAFEGPRVGGPVIHGQYTVTNGNNGYQTYDIQVGKASKVSTSAITVTSADGFAATYTVTPQTVVDAQRDGISTVADGDTVRVLATSSNGHGTATAITDTTKLAASGFGRPQQAPSTGSTTA